ncbi:MAG: transposase [Deltaproteobacteria bacterium]|nr:transposase [Deltaproteobacteria bacterium]
MLGQGAPVWSKPVGNVTVGERDSHERLRQETLHAIITRSTDALLKRKNKKRLILYMDSTEDPAHGNQEQVVYNGHFGKNCFHPLFCFTSDGNGLEAKLSSGNVHSANGTVFLFRRSNILNYECDRHFLY